MVRPAQTPAVHYSRRFEMSKNSLKNLFICGLHRSGTTLLTQCLGSHPLISSFSNTGAEEDEGQHLQDVYPPDDSSGGPGRFVFHRDGPLTEDSNLVTEANRSRLYGQWSAHWDKNKPVLLEKSPPNTTRTRFLQELFSNAYFVFLIRDPVASSYATLKFKRGLPLFFIIWHWVTCYEIMLKDMGFLNRCLLIRYEDFVLNPKIELKKILSFIGLGDRDLQYDLRTIRSDVNLKYHGKWLQLHRPYRMLMELAFESRVKNLGYSLCRPGEYRNPLLPNDSNTDDISHGFDFKLMRLLNAFLLKIGV